MSQLDSTAPFFSSFRNLTLEISVGAFCYRFYFCWRFKMGRLDNPTLIWACDASIACNSGSSKVIIFDLGVPKQMLVFISNSQIYSLQRKKKKSCVFKIHLNVMHSLTAAHIEVLLNNVSLWNILRCLQVLILWFTDSEVQSNVLSQSQVYI